MYGYFFISCDGEEHLDLIHQTADVSNLNLLIRNNLLVTMATEVSVPPLSATASHLSPGADSR